jgi:hypothetical protein
LKEAVQKMLEVRNRGGKTPVDQKGSAKNGDNDFFEDMESDDDFFKDMESEARK